MLVSVIISINIFFEDEDEDGDEDIDLAGVSYLPSHSKDPFVQVPRLLLDLLLVPAILGFLTSSTLKKNDIFLFIQELKRKLSLDLPRQNEMMTKWSPE